jgi:DNA repair photolyase
MAIVAAAAKAGARFAGYIVMRLPYAVKDLFVTWLEEHYPARKNKVLSHILDIRGGKLNDPRFKSRMKGEGVFAEQIRGMFTLACRRAGIIGRSPGLSVAAFQRPPDEANPQLSLFD